MASLSGNKQQRNLYGTARSFRTSPPPQLLLDVGMELAGESGLESDRENQELSTLILSQQRV